MYKRQVLTLDVPAGSATFRPTVQDMPTLLNEGVSTLVVQTAKGSTTLNLSLLVEGQKGTDRVVLRLSLIHICSLFIIDGAHQCLDAGHDDIGVGAGTPCDGVIAVSYTHQMCIRDSILAVDTAGKTAGVALLQDDRLRYEV